MAAAAPTGGSRRRPGSSSVLVQALLLLLLAYTALLPASRAAKIAEQAGRTATGRRLLDTELLNALPQTITTTTGASTTGSSSPGAAPDTASGDGSAEEAFPITVQNQCWDQLQGYLLYSIDMGRYSGEACLEVVDGVCSEPVQVSPDGGVQAATYPSAEAWAWFILPDTDSYTQPLNYTGLDFATVNNANCTEGAEGCLPKFELDVTDGAVVFTCDERVAPSPLADPWAPAPAPALSEV